MTSFNFSVATYRGSLESSLRGIAMIAVVGREKIGSSRGTAVRLITACGAILLLARAAAGQVVQMHENPTRWTLQTEHATYQVVLTRDRELAPGHFGAHADPKLLHASDWNVPVAQGTLLREVPYRGGFVEMTPALEIVFPDHTRELELQYAAYETGMIDGYPFIRFDLKDSHYPFAVSEYIRVLPELDLLEKWLVLTNTGAEAITVERAYSGSALLPPGAYDLIHLSGDWGREFLPRRAQLTSGLKSIFVRTMKSQQHPPVVLIRPREETSEDDGTVWFAEVAWSGNWQIDAEVNRLERTQITGGINFWDTAWQLLPGASFKTPKIIFGVAIDGTNGASRRMHRYTLDHVLPQRAARQASKVLYNSWYATEFDVNEADQVSLAEIAKRIGVELFVIDDGWFKGRVDDRAGLGDWTVDPKKFPTGLKSLIQRIQAMGMDFGIWVEPEMVNRNSDLFRAHPDWVLHTPNRTPHEGRNQLVLNLAREDVKQYTLNWLDRLLSENDISFVKWDMNRSVSEAGWPGVPPERQRELRIRYVNNLYDILRRLRERHPDVVFESCSSGGGRVDLGILQLTDQFWTSDNTDATDRLLIQYGASFAFPAKTMVNWVTDNQWHGNQAPLKFRFHVAMAGNLGIGNDLHRWTEKDIALAKEMIGLYKALRHVIQFGDQYRLASPMGGRTAVQFVTRDRNESVVFVHQPTENVYPKSPDNPVLVLQGLDPNATYRLGNDVEGAAPRHADSESGPEATSGVGTNIEERTMSGRSLMSSGLVVPLQGNYASKMITLVRQPAGGEGAERP